jgi:hypothetical protein
MGSLTRRLFTVVRDGEPCWIIATENERDAIQIASSLARVDAPELATSVESMHLEARQPTDAERALFEEESRKIQGEVALAAMPIPSDFCAALSASGPNES